MIRATIPNPVQLRPRLSATSAEAVTRLAVCYGQEIAPFTRPTRILQRGGRER